MTWCGWWLHAVWSCCIRSSNVTCVKTVLPASRDRCQWWEKPLVFICSAELNPLTSAKGIQFRVVAWFVFSLWGIFFSVCKVLDIWSSKTIHLGKVDKFHLIFIFFFIMDVIILSPNVWIISITYGVNKKEDVISGN